MKTQSAATAIATITQQMAVADLVSAALTSFSTPLETMPADTQALIERLSQRIRSIKYQLNGCNDVLTLPKKDAEKYHHLLSCIKLLLDTMLPTKSGIEYMNMLLALVDDMACETRRMKNAVLRYDWDRVNSFLFDMYLEDDPELQHPDIAVGQSLYNAISAVMRLGR